MSKDKHPHNADAPAEDQAGPLPADSQGTKPKRDWVEWGKTADKPTDDFMPGRIGDLPKD